MAISMKNVFSLDNKPLKGLLAVEWAVLIYLAFTTMLMGFMASDLHSMDSMLLFRFRVVTLMFITWCVYRLAPCNFTLYLRVVIQMIMLADWYPDTYEFNRCFENLDHIFAGWEQSLFGCQVSLWFCETLPWGIISEPLCLGYVSYYPIIVFTVFFYWLHRQQQMPRAAFVIMSSFFLYYLIFIFLPVAGPTFYFRAVGVDVIRQGVYPAIGHYFETHQSLTADCLPTPGWQGGPFWYLVEVAKFAGERPTAAFPSSHVGVTTVCMCLLWRTGNRKVFLRTLPFAVLMFFATFYIQAHYCIDAIAGLVSGVLIYFLFDTIYTRFSFR